MNDIKKIITEKTIIALKELYGENISSEKIQIQETKQDFEGDYTIVVFKLLSISGKTPVEMGTELGSYLKMVTPEIEDFNVVTGFLNITISEKYWQKVFEEINKTQNYGLNHKKDKRIIIEFSSPNTNKPLHLGHMRNNFLGDSIANILKADGNEVVKINLINDRGIHICKSMLAWQELADNQTPQDIGVKGDKFVGDYYVKFNEEIKKQTQKLISEGLTEKEATEQAPWNKKIRSTLRRWERGHKKTRELWAKMNSWVYEGFDATYDLMNIKFDKIYYESDIYLIGKDIVLQALKTGELEQKEDGTVFINLEEYGMDEKVLLRNDGTTVYMTQDIGSAVVRNNDYKGDEYIYVVGNEQDYHFKVLSIILDRLEYPWSNKIQHLSYGMVELPDGKMKSREGKVVDADDLINEMIDNAKEASISAGKLQDFDEKQKNEIYRQIALAALKFFILKVDPQKNMVFNPKESIDFNGHTGPFVQYAYVRINSLMQKALKENLMPEPDCKLAITENEIKLVKTIYNFLEIFNASASKRNPAIIANYVYELASMYNKYYHDVPILHETNKESRNFKLLLSKQVGEIIKNSLELLGIQVPEAM